MKPHERPSPHGLPSTHLPIPINDYALIEARTTRWEAAAWDTIGLHIAQVLAQLGGSREGISQILNVGWPQAAAAVKDELQEYLDALPKG